MKQKQKAVKQKRSIKERFRKFLVSFWRGIKERFRKFLVSLKRNPQNIPFVALGVAFLVYSLNLTSISNTTASINTANMGQCEFCAMLFSILAFVCFMRAFPKRQKVKKVMLGLMFFMLALLVFVDGVYLMRIGEAMTRADNPVVIGEKNAYIATAQSIVQLHIIFVCVCAALVATLPIYGKLLKKINTSIDVEGNGDMGVIDISGED